MYAPSAERPTVLLCTGTRREIVGMAPVYHALRATALRPVVAHTGPPDPSTRALFRFFRMRPMPEPEPAGEHLSSGHLSAALLDRLDRRVGEAAARAVLVHGDTAAALAAALGAFRHGVPVGHVEAGAGLRGPDGRDASPGAKHCELVARLARWHFAPTPCAADTLCDEGIPAPHVFRVGSTLADATRWALGQLDRQSAGPDDALRELLRDRRLVFVATHRRESWGAPVAGVARAVGALAARHRDLAFVWPLHPDPALRAAVADALAGLPRAVARRIRLTEPLDYPAQLALLRRAWLVMTDAPEVEEEAAALDRPVLALRDAAGRPEAPGGGALVGTDPALIEGWGDVLATDPVAYATSCTRPRPLTGAGAAIARVLEMELAGVAAPSLVVGLTAAA